MKKDITHLGADVGRTTVKLVAQTSESGRIEAQLPSREISWGSESDILNAIGDWERTLDGQLHTSAKISIAGSGALEYERMFTHHSRVIQIVSDLTASALSCGIKSTGLIIIAGTGGSSLILNRGKKELRKSYGPIIGDLWGGLFLGRLAARHLLDYWTAGERFSSFERALAAHLGIQSRSEFLELLHNHNEIYTTLATLGKITVEYTDKGHLEAEAILGHMLENIMEEIRYAFDAVEPAGDLSIGLQGSVLLKSDLVQQSLERRLRRADIPAGIKPAEQPLEQVMLMQAKNLSHLSENR